MSLSFEAAVRALFRQIDVDAMSYVFDLWAYDEVVEHAEAIYIRLTEGSMPCDGAWPAEDIEKFRRWIDGGMEP